MHIRYLYPENGGECVHVDATGTEGNIRKCAAKAFPTTNQVEAVTSFAHSVRPGCLLFHIV